jgi:hypothetical protein
MPSHTLGVARRATFYEAHRAFIAGSVVLVSERGDPELEVCSDSTWHTKETTTWDALIELVRMWRGRYPHQRYYIWDRPCSR